MIEYEMSEESKFIIGCFVLLGILLTLGYIFSPELRNTLRWALLGFGIIGIFLLFTYIVKKSKQKILYCIPIVLSAFIVAIMINNEIKINNQLASLNIYLAEYFSTYKIDVNDKEKINKRIKMDGILPIDFYKQQIDKSIYFGLPNEIVARRPDDVNYIIFLRKETKIVGRYNDGTAAYKNYCDIKVIDYRKKLFLFEDTIFGGDPPKTKRAGTHGIGSDPNIISYIVNLQK